MWKFDETNNQFCITWLSVGAKELIDLVHWDELIIVQFKWSLNLCPQDAKFKQMANSAFIYQLILVEDDESV